MGATVLLVDDDDFARHFSRAVLAHAGYRVLEASEMAVGVELARTENPSIVIVDFFLPDGDGLELASQVHLDSPDLPIILISGDTSQFEDMPETGAFSAVIQKPFSPSVLLQAISSAQARAAL